MRTIIESLPTHVIDFIQKLRRQLCDTQFSARHGVRPEDFPRQRQLTFPIVMLFVLQKTVKSIQRHRHEFLNELAGEGLFEPVTAGAWTHARAKLKHTAFIEMNHTIQTFRPSTARCALFPLLGGEDQGEGKQGEPPSLAHRTIPGTVEDRLP